EYHCSSYTDSHTFIF
nr:immunoglobulin light chain junction region [Macaca mulatta]